MGRSRSETGQYGCEYSFHKRKEDKILENKREKEKKNEDKKKAESNKNENVLSLPVSGLFLKSDTGTVSGVGTKIVVEVFVVGVSDAILGGNLSFDLDTNLLKVQYANADTGICLRTTDTTVDIAMYPAVNLSSSGLFATVTFVTVSDPVDLGFQIDAQLDLLVGVAGKRHIDSFDQPLNLQTRQSLLFNHES